MLPEMKVGDRLYYFELGQWKIKTISKIENGNIYCQESGFIWESNWNWEDFWDMYYTEESILELIHLYNQNTKKSIV